MAHQLRRRNVSSSVEKRILTALIVSTQFNYEISHLIKFDYFTNSFIRTVARWCVDFFDTYEKAPFNHIQDIYNDRKVELKDEDAELIETLLNDISNKYELDSGLNVEYSIEQALKFFKTRELEITYGNIKTLLDQNNIDGAEEQINQYTKISKLTSGWINPFDAGVPDQIFQDEKLMFKFPGVLGDFLGAFDRGWLVGIAAAFKRGKTFQMQELAVTAMQQRLKVAFFSLEMYSVPSNKRLYQRLLGTGLEEKGTAIYPCFDCASNQDGSCKKKERTNSITLLVNDKKPQFSPKLNYKPCTYCRTSNKEEDRGFYKIAWWKELLEREAFNKSNVEAYRAAMEKVYKNNYRFKQYPRFSANTTDIIRDLDILERTEGFVPDIICIADGSLVLTEKRGLIPIEDIKITDKLWDGLNWVTHEGLIYKGEKEVIKYGNIEATPEHLIWTEHGWRTIESCKRLGLRIAQTECNGKEIRVGRNYISYGKSQRKGEKKKWTKAIRMVCTSKMFNMWKRKMDKLWQSIKRFDKRVQNLLTTEEVPKLVLCKSTSSSTALYMPKQSELEKLWWKRDKIQFQKCNRSLSMDKGKFRDIKKQKTRVRQNRQRWSLRAWKHKMVNKGAELSSHKKTYDKSEDIQVQTTISTCKVCRRYFKKIFSKDDSRRNSKTMGRLPIQKKRVWDIKNAGHLHRFTVQGTLVHNCIDYADILKPESAGGSVDTSALDDTWKSLARLAGERHALVVTASQLNRAGADKKQVKSGDMALWIGKLAHVDVFYALNQTPEEKADGLMRVSLLAHRYADFNENDNCIILQNLSHGQVCLDSELMR